MKVDMTSNDVDRQAYLLKYYPELVAKHYKPALSRVVELGEAVIRPNIPVGASGRLADNFTSKVSGRAITSIKGQIGWFDNAPRYLHLMEDGAAAHGIEPKPANKPSARRAAAGGKPANALRWMDGGSFVFSKKVDHPGVSKRGFIAAGFAFIQPVSNVELQQAGDALLRELEVK